MSALTGVCCYVVMRLIGIDFAATWALLIFFLNFIPNIGSIVGVSLPALVALVQFDTLGPFVIVVVGLTSINLAIGSVLEPMLMGKTLNMSPFAIILSLGVLGDDLGHRRHVLERADHGARHDHLRARPGLAMGGNSAVEGWKYRRALWSPSASQVLVLSPRLSVERERHMNDVAIAPLPHRQAAAPEDGKHGLIFASTSASNCDTPAPTASPL